MIKVLEVNSERHPEMVWVCYVIIFNIHVHQALSAQILVNYSHILLSQLDVALRDY